MYLDLQHKPKTPHLVHGTQIVTEYENEIADNSNSQNNIVNSESTEQIKNDIQTEENITSTDVTNKDTVSSTVPPTTVNTAKPSTSTNNKPTNNATSTTTKPSTNTNKPSTNTPPPTTNTTPPPPSTSTPPPTTNNTPTIQGKIINLKLNNGSVIQISLEDYIIGVVGAEMPASFQTEALKAQAVAARTYALSRTTNGETLTATTSHQVYKTNEQLKATWGASFSTYYNKIKSAVEATKGEYISYNGKYIDAVYFSTSNGKTEDAVNVWGESKPYLKSVDSPWDTKVSSFSSSKTISMSTISSKLGVNLTSASQIVINSTTIGNRVKSITVCGKEFTGVQIRTLLGLRSADFTVTQNGNNIVFSTKGFGHGVGMSQYGANEMAKTGKTYRQILTHYYTGVQITK